jgi:hypothetical protein
MTPFTAKQVKESRSKAFEKIKTLLDAENVDAQFTDRNGSYYSNEKFIVTWNANWQGIPSEYGIDKTDSFYAAYSGAKAVYVTRGLLHEKQLGSYESIERALIVFGLKLCPKKEKKAFFEKYATRYNARLKKEAEENSKKTE